MSIRTWVGRFSIVEGQVREEGPWLGAYRRHLPDDESRDLYVLVEPALPGSDEFCGQLVEVVGRLFQRESLSMTGALLRSLRAAHDNLRDWNRKSLAEHQVAAGATCLLLRGRTAYVAQVGPSLAYFYRNGRLETMTPQEEEAQAPLGVAEEFRVDITRYDLEPGDLLLLASPRLASITDDPAVAGALSRGPDDALPEIFLLTRDLLNFSALVATCFVETEEPPPDAPAVPQQFSNRPAEGEPAHTDEAEHDSGTEGGEEAGPPERRRVRQTVLWPSGSTPDEGRWGEGGRGRGPPNGGHGGSPVALMAPPAIFQRVREAPRAVSSRTAPTAVCEESPPRNGDGYDLLVPRLDSPPVGMEHPVVRLRAPAATPRYRYTRTTSTLPRIFPVPRLAVLAALAVLFVGLGAWLVVPRMARESQEDTFNSLVASARSSLQAEPGLADAAQRRDLLSGALARLEEAGSIHPDDGQVRALQVQVKSSLAELDAVVDLGEMRPVADLTLQVAGELSLSQVVLGGGSAFLLDEEGGRVLELPLGGGGGARVVFQDGALAGMVTASRPGYILWSQANGESGRLLVLDGNRHLFAIAPGGEAAPLVLRDAQAWGSLDGASVYGGNLYILDVTSNQVWRYTPTDSGFDSERSGVLGQADLSGATGLFVDRDVYLYTKDGGLRRFAHGIEQPFSLAGIDRSLRAPASLTGDGKDGLLLVDRGNKRLVSLSPDGKFQAQFVSRTFTGLRSAAVDAGAGLLYVVVGDSLYVTETPRP